MPPDAGAGVSVGFGGAVVSVGGGSLLGVPVGTVVEVIAMTVDVTAGGSLVAVAAGGGFVAVAAGGTAVAAAGKVSVATTAGGVSVAAGGGFVAVAAGALVAAATVVGVARRDVAGASAHPTATDASKKRSNPAIAPGKLIRIFTCLSPPTSSRSTKYLAWHHRLPSNRVQSFPLSRGRRGKLSEG